MTTENLRREARVEVRVPVVILRGKKAAFLETSDVSFKGLFVETAEPPPLLSLVRLRVTVSERDLELHAMAVHVVLAGDAEGRAPGVGLQFWGLSGLDRTVWDDFVRGLVQARRAVVAPVANDVRPVLSQPSTPSGVRIVGPTAITSSKS